jgi:AI-2 transport protein TqsA
MNGRASVDEPTQADPGTWSSTVRGVATSPIGLLLLLVLVLVAILGIREVAELVVPVIFGLFLALLAMPAVRSLERRGFRYPIALAGASAVIVAVLVAVAVVIAFSVGELVVRVPAYEDRLLALVDDARALLAQVGVSTDPGSVQAVVTPGALLSIVRPVASAVSDAVIAIFVLAFTMIYALAGAPSLRERAVAAFGEQHPVFEGVERFGVDLRRYLIVRAQLGLFAAVLVLILLIVLGVPLPALWAFLVFAASFIPTVGTIIALVPPTILALLDSGVATAAGVVIGFVLVNVAQDYLLQPRMMGTGLNLSPLVVFLSVIAWAWVLGAAGALLAVPLTVGVVVMLEAHPSTRGVAAMMRNKLEADPGVLEGPTVGAPPPSSGDEGPGSKPGDIR